MYAVVKIKNQQYRVAPEATLQVPLLDSEVGASLTFEEVLMFADGDDITKLSKSIVYRCIS